VIRIAELIDKRYWLVVFYDTRLEGKLGKPCSEAGEVVEESYQAHLYIFWLVVTLLIYCPASSPIHVQFHLAYITSKRPSKSLRSHGSHNIPFGHAGVSHQCP
jgi:hypothetical protein